MEESDTMEAVQKLPPKYKEVIILFYYMGYKTDEIAEKLGKPPSTIRNLLADARKKLKAMIGDAR
ncbi:MAG: sigma-70 family RNA polymerase sigma factor [Lachnospiraceae bacterium]|nr:sigma-70 family RNA polymerase sigma factor [Lachnospiraceae bacterium]